MAPMDITPREQELMALAWQCFEDQPKVDYKKLARLAGMTNPTSACNAWARIKKKIAAGAPKTNNGDEAAEEDGETETMQKTPKKRGKAAADAGRESPAKKTRVRNPTTKKLAEERATAEANGGEEDEEEGDDGAIKEEDGEDV